MLKLENIKMPVLYTDNDLENCVLKKLKTTKENLVKLVKLKESIDARKKNDVFYVLTVAVKLKNYSAHAKKFPDVDVDYSGLNYSQIKTNKKNPLVVGFGPAGMFCALALAKMGLNPVVVEQGECVEERSESVKNFWINNKLNPYSNVQFGEGGAGTFSDGKLNSNISNQYSKKVINEFFLAGAPKEIYYKSKPHLGSDNLPKIVKNIREQIIELGGKVLFNTKLVDFKQNNQDVDVKLLNVKTKQQTNMSFGCLVLAVGHSARDVYKLLKDKNFNLNKKPFAIGVRIEQKQKDINIAQYGEKFASKLPSADYKLAVHLPCGRSVFTFCMCPGGEVVSSSSEDGLCVTNGMSLFNRDGKFANSALLVNVLPEDFDGDVLSGVEFQQKYEKLAFDLCKTKYALPVQFVGDFLNDNSQIKEEFLNQNQLADFTSIKCKTEFVELKNCMPEFVYNSLKEGLVMMDKKLKNFAEPHNLLIGLETRTSAPLTIVRDSSFMAKPGIFPCGEGAGYAGGIITSAIDGIKTAEAVAKYYS